MKSVLDQEHSLEEILPEDDLANLGASLSRFLGAELALFSREGELLGHWRGGAPARNGTEAVGKTVRGQWDQLNEVSAPLPLEKLGAGAVLAPISLDLDLVGALALVPSKGALNPGTVEVLQQILSSTLYAHYRTLLASQMQVAATEQSYEDLERQNAELREAYDRLKTLDRLKSDFVANVNHELRTPLTALLGFTELLQLDTSNLTQDQIESLEQIYDKTNHLITLVNRILVFTESGGERPKLQYTTFDLAQAVAEIIAQHERPAKGRGISLVLKTPEEPLPSIEADREKITAVIDNLLENAMKFSPPGEKVEVVLEATKDPDVAGNAFLAMAESGPTEILLHVIDHGQGFSPTQVQEIFTDFHQLDTSSTREFGGMGLGLALARRVIEIHGGRIMVDSAPGQGSHFVVTLPLGPSPELRTSPKRRVLVVEDESFIIQLIGSFLKERGYEVLSAHNAAEAARLVHSEPIDLMLLDVRLPDRLGVELLEELRRDEMSRSLPVVVITALSDAKLHARARQAGALDVLLKPFTRERLLEAVQSALE